MPTLPFLAVKVSEYDPCQCAAFCPPGATETVSNVYSPFVSRPYFSKMAQSFATGVQIFRREVSFMPGGIRATWAGVTSLGSLEAVEAILLFS